LSPPAMIYLLPLLVSVAFACGPAGTGSDATLIQNPTFTFEFSPPAAWTFFTVAAHTGALANSVIFAGQKTNVNEARQQIQNDLDNAILKALNTLRVQAFGVQYALSGYTPEDIVIRDGAVGTNLVGTYVPETGAVVAIRTVQDSNAGTPYRFKGSVRVGNAPLATRGQWKAIANEVYKNMYLNARVKFYTPITVN
ncbi:hypothetical protein PFISCL1PPCAC_23818, partial [Pristionchus fissidentatus]